MNVIDWLLDSDPSIRWQVMRDLTDESAEAVAAERSRVATEGWGARLLALQSPDGRWGGGVYHPKWTSTYGTLLVLKDLGVDPDQTRDAIALTADNVTWEGMLPDDAEWHGRHFFSGEVEPCINGIVLGLGAYFGEPNQELLDRLLSEPLNDGGWNCEAPSSSRSSFDTTICVLEGLLEYERAVGATPATTQARERAQEYLLERRMFRSLSTGEVIDPTWTQFSFPTYFYYDVLRGLDYLRAAGVEPDDRMAEALELVERNRDEDGRWPLQNPHPGEVHFDMDPGPDQPSRWNTLRARRVLKWGGSAEALG